MDDLKKNKGSRTTSSGIHVIETNLSTSDSWVLDTRSGSHICTNVQGLKGVDIWLEAKWTYELAMEQELML